MAGIGFELKALFSKKGIFAILRAYGYAGIVCVGPTLLGIILLLGVYVLSQIGGLSEHDQNLLICMITYTLLASLMVTNAISMITTRYIADALYIEEEELVMPSFYGSLALMFLIGGGLYGVFLLFAGITPLYQVLCLVLFMELLVVWTEINYLTAIKDYRGILGAFAGALTAALLVGLLLVKNGFPVIPALLGTVVLSYGLMMVWYYILMLRYFPGGNSSSLQFLKWYDRYPALGGIGIAVACGLFLHLVIMWFSPIGSRITGLFFFAPSYDVPALFAFVSILITTINFVTSVEVNFYPKYRTYFSLYNNSGSLLDIEQAEKEMRETLWKELSYTFSKQLFVTMVFIIGGTLILPRLPLGFSEEMLGTFRVMCVGYAFYAAGNCTMLILLYFSDNAGALCCTVLYAVISAVGTAVLAAGKPAYYGFGFMIGGIVFTVSAIARLRAYLKHLGYHVLCRQPIVARVKYGTASRISDYFIKKYALKEKGLKNREEAAE